MCGNSDLSEGCAHGRGSGIGRRAGRDRRFGNNGCVGRRNSIRHSCGLRRSLRNGGLRQSRLDGCSLLSGLRFRSRLVLLIGIIREEEISYDTEEAE